MALAPITEGAIPHSQWSCARKSSLCLGVITVALGILAIIAHYHSGLSQLNGVGVYGGSGLILLGMSVLAYLYVTRSSTQAGSPTANIVPGAPRGVVVPPDAEVSEEFDAEDDLQEMAIFHAVRDEKLNAIIVRVQNGFGINNLDTHLRGIYRDQIPNVWVPPAEDFNTYLEEFENQITLLLSPDIDSLPLSLIGSSLADELLCLRLAKAEPLDPSSELMPLDPHADFDTMTVGELRGIKFTQLCGVPLSFLKEIPSAFYSQYNSTQIQTLLGLLEIPPDSGDDLEDFILSIFPLDQQSSFEKTKREIRELPQTIIKKYLREFSWFHLRLLSNTQLENLGWLEVMPGYLLGNFFEAKNIENTRRMLRTLDQDAQKGLLVWILKTLSIGLNVLPQEWLKAEWFWEVVDQQQRSMYLLQLDAILPTLSFEVASVAAPILFSHQIGTLDLKHLSSPNFPWKAVLDSRKPEDHQKTLERLIRHLKVAVLERLSPLLDDSLIFENCTSDQKLDEDFPWKVVAKEIGGKDMWYLLPRLSDKALLVIMPYLLDHQFQAFEEHQIKNFPWKEAMTTWSVDERNQFFTHAPEGFFENVNDEAKRVLTPFIPTSIIRRDLIKV